MDRLIQNGIDLHKKTKDQHIPLALALMYLFVEDLNNDHDHDHDDTQFNSNNHMNEIYHLKKKYPIVCLLLEKIATEKRFGDYFGKSKEWSAGLSNQSKAQFYYDLIQVHSSLDQSNLIKLFKFYSSSI